MPGKKLPNSKELLDKRRWAKQGQANGYAKIMKEVRLESLVRLRDQFIKLHLSFYGRKLERYLSRPVAALACEGGAVWIRERMAEIDRLLRGGQRPADEEVFWDLIGPFEELLEEVFPRVSRESG